MAASTRKPIKRKLRPVARRPTRKGTERAGGEPKAAKKATLRAVTVKKPAQAPEAGPGLLASGKGPVGKRRRLAQRPSTSQAHSQEKPLNAVQEPAPLAGVPSQLKRAGIGIPAGDAGKILEPTPAPPVLPSPSETSVSLWPQESEPGVVRSPAPKLGEKSPAPAPAAEPIPKLPPILLEGDELAPAAQSGPGQKFFTGSGPIDRQQPKPEERPSAYGTGVLLATPRDPHCLYVHWNLASEQQRRYNALSASRHLSLRLYLHPEISQPIAESELHPESDHWFIHVGQAGATYVTELGYYQADGQWSRIASSKPVATPSERVAEAKPEQFLTVSPNVPLRELASQVRAVAREGQPWVSRPERPHAEAATQLHERRPSPSTKAVERRIEATPLPGIVFGHQPTLDASAAPESQEVASFESAGSGASSAPTLAPPGEWSAAQELALAELIGLLYERTAWQSGSVEISELLRRQPPPEISSVGAAELALPAPGRGQAVTAVSSPAGGELGQGLQALAPGLAPRFWLNVNAELIIYGATEPDARVAIGGREIRLRSDGSFSYRFALPDGHYELDVTALSAASDLRRAGLQFSRQTAYTGEVGAHPQDAGLKIPAAENVS